MNSIARNVLDNMRNCLCKSSKIRPSQGFNISLSAERCSTNFTIVIQKRVFSCQNKALLQNSLDNLLKRDVYSGPNTLINASKPAANLKCYCTSPRKDEEQKPLSIFQKFKALYRDYWYVLVPVHMATSAVWFGGFYYMAKSGVDIIPILEFLRVSDTIIDKFRSEHFEKAGYVALAFAFYKLATPLRYASTLGGTTVFIRHLKTWGYLKPIPPKEQLKEMCLEQKRILMDKKDQIKNNVLIKKNSLIETKNQLSKIKDNVLNPLERVPTQGKIK
ncbi:protein FAM210A isoform X2 [Nilaparvata lugens]|uniref:protein FAM210A isoform X2 n=1 Tax=Nilaparvata lugens TaxID=108931 RepID=UPI00193D2578|nr:protein FAM210A isoform X2 [Nilaparvata lugens]